MHPNKTVLQGVKQGANFLGAIIFPHHTYPRERQVKSLKVKIKFFNKLINGDKLTIIDIPVGGVWKKYMNEEKCKLGNQSIKRKILSSINSYYGLFIHSKSYSLRKKIYFSIGELKEEIIPSSMNFTKFIALK